MSVLVVPGMVADLADTNRVSSDYPFVTEVLPSPDSVLEVCANFTFQLGHDFFHTLLFSDAVEPRHRLELAIEIALPLLKRSALGASFLGALCFVGLLSSFHAW